MAQDPNDTPTQGASDLPEWAQIRASVGADDDGFEDFDTPAAPAAPAADPQSGPARPALPPMSAAPPVPVPAQPLPAPQRPAIQPVAPLPATLRSAPAAPTQPAPIAPIAPSPAATPALPAHEQQVAPAYARQPDDHHPLQPQPAPQQYVVTTTEPQVPAELQAPTAARPAPQPTGWAEAATAGAPTRAAGVPADWEAEATQRRRGVSLPRLGGGGARWKLVAVRTVTWVVLGLLLTLGVLRLINPSTLSAEEIVDQVKVALGRGDFPAERGESMAKQFLLGYLTFTSDPKVIRDRQESLQRYLADDVSSDAVALRVSDDRYSQEIVEGPFLATTPDVVSDTHVGYTFAVRVSTLTGAQIDAGEDPTQQWIYVMVPMIADADGNVAVAGPVAFVPAPPRAAGTSGVDWPVDEAASEEVRAFVEPYFTAWAQSSNPEDVNVYTRAESTYAAKNGLGGAVELVKLNEIFVRTLPDGETQADGVRRVAVVSLTWRTFAGVETAQTYRIALTELNDKWFILDVRGSDFV